MDNRSKWTISNVLSVTSFMLFVCELSVVTCVLDCQFDCVIVLLLIPEVFLAWFVRTLQLKFVFSSAHSSGLWRCIVPGYCLLHCSSM